VHRGIWLVIELGQDTFALCLPTCSPSLIKTGGKLFDIESGNPNLDNSRAIIKECLGEFVR